MACQPFRHLFERFSWFGVVRTVFDKAMVIAYFLRVVESKVQSAIHFKFQRVFLAQWKSGTTYWFRNDTSKVRFYAKGNVQIWYSKDIVMGKFGDYFVRTTCLYCVSLRLGKGDYVSFLCNSDKFWNSGSRQCWKPFQNSVKCLYLYKYIHLSWESKKYNSRFKIIPKRHRSTFEGLTVLRKY